MDIGWQMSCVYSCNFVHVMCDTFILKGSCILAFALLLPFENEH